MLLGFGLGVDVVAEVEHHVTGLQFVDATNLELRKVWGRGGGDEEGE